MKQILLATEFIPDQAIRYDLAQARYNNARSYGDLANCGEDFLTWQAYADYVCDIWDKWAGTGTHLRLQPEYIPYTPTGLRAELLSTGRLPVWSGGCFTPDHPMALTKYSGIPAYVISRAVHDLQAHLNAPYFGFTCREELRAAWWLHVKGVVPRAAAAAAWTDDVAMTCYREYFGHWPVEQAPVIVAPAWGQLIRALSKSSSTTKWPSLRE